MLHIHAPLLASEALETRNPDTGLLTWEIDDRGFSLKLIQLLPDFVRAVYESHNFPRDAIEDIARHCVFGSIAINTSNKSLHYRVTDWYALTANREKYSIKTKSQWIEDWRKIGIRYSWTLLPAEQTFEIGDWSQGFTTIKVPREESFDLIYSWSLDGNKHEGKIKNMSCAPVKLETR